ncbi:hypothetical protein ZEAMMB73_Zm00001d014407 [Zea mays]|jgi:hypothetical protein|uniref:Uncharacterized protein n=1 Tax=Zea mays TaxID=4577 RepID=A0A1D6GSY5_MAIZE|nr:hypothetical protein ZEAMMB73_Zm00001d014407 [Zea mays]
MDLGAGDRILVSWDLHDWLFPVRDASPPAAATAPPSHAIFVFRFELAGRDDVERDPANAMEKEVLQVKGSLVVYVDSRWGRGD